MDAPWRPTASLATLRRRAALLESTRCFFAERGVLEVEVPVLQGGANFDPGITPLRVETPDGPRFLPTSPEHPLKRLVAAGAGPVWAMAPAFRAGERGQRHGPEFRMLEWYRPGWDDRQLQTEALTLLAHLTGLGERYEEHTYRSVFRDYVGFDPMTATDDIILQRVGDDRPAVSTADGALDRQAALDLLMGTVIEPRLGRGKWSVITGYPATTAAQARLRPDPDGYAMAARFEIYRNGLELANGYWELTDPQELIDRLRHQQYTKALPDLMPDQRFEAAMQAGLGECAGIAVGFDRVVMVALNLPDLAQTQAFGWLRA